MQRNLVSFLFAALLSTSAFADRDATPAEKEKIQAALAVVGCSGGEIEQEDRGTFEIDDATCKDGQYDIKLDKDFKILSMERD